MAAGSTAFRQSDALNYTEGFLSLTVTYNEAALTGLYSGPKPKGSAKSSHVKLEVETIILQAVVQACSHYPNQQKHWCMRSTVSEFLPALLEVGVSAEKFDFNWRVD